jgi:hypothetical protein
MKQAGAETGLQVEQIAGLCLLFERDVPGGNGPIRIKATLETDGERVKLILTGTSEGVDPVQEILHQKKMTELVAAATTALKDVPSTASTGERVIPLIPENVNGRRNGKTPAAEKVAQVDTRAAELLKTEDLERLRDRLSQATIPQGGIASTTPHSPAPIRKEVRVSTAPVARLDRAAFERELKERFATFDATFTRAFRELANGVSAVHETELPEMRASQVLAVLDRFAPDFCRLADGATMSLASSLGSLIREHTRRHDIRGVTERRIVDDLLGDSLAEFVTLHSDLARDLRTMEDRLAPERERVRKEILKLLNKLPEMRDAVLEQTLSMVGGDLGDPESVTRFSRSLVADVRRMVYEWRAGLEGVDQYIRNTVPPPHPGSAIAWFIAALPGTVAAGVVLYLAMGLVGSLATSLGLFWVMEWAQRFATVLEQAPFIVVPIVSGLIAGAVFWKRFKRWREFLGREPEQATVVESVRNSLAVRSPTLATSEGRS